MAVYLLHFNQPYKHAKHYLGFSYDLEARLHAHKSGTGARLMEVISLAGIGFTVARVWPEGDRTLEHQLKGWHGGTKLCPICAQERTARRLGILND